MSNSALIDSNCTRTSESKSTIFKPCDQFGEYVFCYTKMQKVLKKEVFDNMIAAINGTEKIRTDYADQIAVAMKELALSFGATHYTHWFMSLTGSSAEKHDAFIEWSNTNTLINKFSSKQLIQGEPDASSFPSGGLRSTHEARGYTGWDPSSPAFIIRSAQGVTLCIPSVFFSWTGALLDHKVPLLRSNHLLNCAVVRLLKLVGSEAKHAYATLGIEQEYFIIDKSLRNLRPDLVLLGKTVIGASPPKGQELQDYYFTSINDRVLCFMNDFEKMALKLGIPVKTRHNEVAPAQHEIAPIFERSSVALDHNILLMNIMKQVAEKHDLACLFHEKPFKNFNGSGKHCNWSISTDEGLNLFDPTDHPESNITFLVLVTALLKGFLKHSKILRASIGSPANDFRLGGHEAPPAIFSVYLGDALEALLDAIEGGSAPTNNKKDKYDLGLPLLPDFEKDSSDRNRTSPFAFTGNKFEFRAVGSSAIPSMAITTLNLILTESLNEILDELEASKVFQAPKDKIVKEANPILAKYLKQSKKIRFSGDNYCEKWIEESMQKGLPNIEKSLDAYYSLKEESTYTLFKGVLTPKELESRFDILTETYYHTIRIEINLIQEIFKTYVVPAALKYQKNVAKSISKAKELLHTKGLFESQEELLNQLCMLVDEGLKLSKKMTESYKNFNGLDMKERAKIQTKIIFPTSQKLREVCDALEEIVDDSLWPLPKYRELLYMV